MPTHGPGIQPFGTFSAMTWAVGPGWYKPRRWRFDKEGDVQAPGPGGVLEMGVDSLEDLDLGVKRRGNLQRRNVCPLKARIEKAMHAVRRHGELASSVDAENT